MSEDSKVSMDTVESTVHLHWSGLGDLDLMALVVGKDNIELVSFAHEGSLEEEPYLQLLSDFAFEEVPTDNQEILKISPQQFLESASVWFFCWDFEHVEEGGTAPFSEYELYLEVRQQDRRVSTTPFVESCDGNAVCISRWDIQGGEQNGVLMELNQPLSMPLLADMSEVKAHLHKWVQTTFR